MSGGSGPDMTELSPQETALMLRRILDAVEEPRHHRWLELTVGLVLALATTASTWCAYESIRWGGVQTFRLAAAAKAGRESSLHLVSSLQKRAFDITALLPYIEAKMRGGEEKFVEFLHERFRPEARLALDAWFKTDPFNNPDAPKRPFEMAEYVEPELEQARLCNDEETAARAEAQQANEISDKYVLLTVLFASVLFFGGIGGTFQSMQLRLAIFIIAVVLLLGTLSMVVTMPICSE